MTSAFGGFMSGFAGGFGTVKQWQAMDAKEKREVARDKREGEAHDQSSTIRKLGIERAEKEAPVLDKELEVRAAKADFDLTEQGFAKEMQTFEQNTRRLLAENKKRGATIQQGALAGQEARQPDELKLAREELNTKVRDTMLRQTASLWHVFKLGNKDAAIELFNKSQLLAPNEKAKDLRIEEVKGPDGKMVKMLVVEPEGDGEIRRLPAEALDALENQYGAKYEKVDNNIVRIGRDGTVTPVYQGGTEVAESDAGGLFYKKGPKAGQTIPAAGGIGEPGQGQGGASAPAPGSQAAARIDARVKMAIDKVIMPRFGGRFEGGLFFPEEANKAVATRATQLAGEMIRKGMDPERAGVQAVDMAEREDALRKAGGANPGGGTGGYKGPTPWKR